MAGDVADESKGIEPVDDVFNGVNLCSVDKELNERGCCCACTRDECDEREVLAKEEGDIGLPVVSG